MPQVSACALCRVAALLFVLLPGSYALAAPTLPGQATPSVAGPPAPAATHSVTAAVSAIRLLMPMLQVKAEGHLSDFMVLGGYAGWGAPSRDGLKSKSQLELGVHMGAYLLGNRHRGAGVVLQFRGLRAQGTLGELKSTSYGLSGTLFASGRFTFDSNAVVELQVGRDYLYSWVALNEGKQGDGQGQQGMLVNVWFGWSF